MENISGAILALFFLWLLCDVTHGAFPCISRDFGHGSYVCVCNATYCDTVDPVVRVPRGKYILYTSSKRGLRFSKDIGDFHKTQFNGLVFTISPEEKYQEMIGFGGAFTDAFGINIKKLSKNSQDNLLKSYFADTGIEYSTGRIPIGGTDFSPRPYSLDDGSPDPQLLRFNLTQEDYKYKIPIIIRAKELSNEDIWFFGSAWSAPAWMKTNNALNGLGKLKYEYYDSWAQYHIKFLEAYSNANITISALTTGNEPLDGIIPWTSINSLGWFPWRQKTWINQNLGPAIKNSKYNKTKIIIHDDQRLLFPWTISLILSNSEVDSYVAGIGVHWYTDFLTPTSFLKMGHERAPDKFILYTEASSGFLPWERCMALGKWKRGEDYLKSIIQTTNNWVSGWTDWNLALDMEGGPAWTHGHIDSPIIVDASNDQFYKQPMFYAMGHASKFIKPGSVKLGVKPQNQNCINIMAVKNKDGGIVAVILNEGAETTITVHDNSVGYAQLKIPAKSFNSLLYW